MGTMSDVVAALHELTDGKRAKPADVIKDFNLLMNSRDRDVSSNISQILETFQPTTSLGKFLRLKLIGRYKASSEVWTLLQSDDALQIKQAMKFDWFFMDVEDPTTIVQDVIPKLSLSTRLKIINRYATCLKNSAAGEEIYIGLKLRYGIKSAITMLPACGEDFVKNELQNLTVLIPPSVLMILVDKYPSIAIEYIKLLVSDESRKHANLRPYKCVFVQLSHKDADTFFELFNKHHTRFPSLKLGRRPLKKAIKNHFDDISKCYKKFDGLLDWKQFIHRLSLEQVKTLYVSSLLPSKSSEFFDMSLWWEPYSFLRYVKLTVRSDIVISTFQMKYNKDCLSSDLLHKFRLDCLQFLPTDAKIDWINLKVPEIECVEDQAEAIAYLPVETSLPRLKQLITAQSDATVRAAIAKFMVKTLKLNQCFSGIKDVARYFVERFRNETKGFRQTVISEMGELGELFLKMDWEDWTSINEFIDLIKLNDEVPVCQGGLRNIYSQQIHTCFLKKMDVDPYLRGYLEFEQRANEDVRWSSTLEIGKGTPYHRQCIEWFLKELPTLRMKSTEGKCYAPFLSDLMDTLVNYNHNHKRSKIELPDWLVKELGIMVSSESSKYDVLRIFERLTKNKDFELRDHLLLTNFPKFSDCDILCRFLKKHPGVILSNLDFLMNNILSFTPYSWKSNNFTKRCKLYDNIRVEMVKACFTTLDQAVKADDSEYYEQIKMKTNAVKVLAELMEPRSYLEFCLNHVPAKEKIEEHSKEVKTDYAIQRAVCKSFARISTPLDTLPVLRKFVGGNNLKIVYGSLIGVCVRIPENIIVPILKEWVGCPVSLRKHILRLMYNIAPVDCSITTFENLFRAEKNVSLRLVLFLQMRDRFIAEPTDDSFHTFTSIVQQVTENDREILDKLFDINNITDAFLSQYVELIWQLIDSKWTNVLPNGKSKVVGMVDEKVIKLLSNSVCDWLLAHELSVKLPNEPLSKYLYLYLLYSCSDDVQHHRLDTVMAALEPYIRTLWNECERSASGHVFIVRHLISDIVESLCVESLNTGDFARATSVLSSMKKALLKLIELRDTMKECIQLDAYSIYLNLKQSGEESAYASASAELYNKYILQYDSEFGYSLVRHLTLDIPMVSNMELAHELLKNHSHPTCHILATKILNNVWTEEDDVSLYQTIIEVLSKSSHPHVQAAASDYFRSLEVNFE